MNRQLVIATGGATALLAASRMIEHRVVGSALASPSAMLQFVAAGASAAAVLVWLAAQASVDRRRTLVMMFAIGGIIIVMNNIEALVFRIGPTRAIGWLIGISIGVHALVVAFIGRTMPLHPTSDDAATAVRANRSPRFWIVRFVALGGLYGVIYFVAGATIYPFVHDFYAATQLPGPGMVLALQVLVRGPAFVGVGVLVVLLVRGSRGRNAAAAAATLAGLGGVAALIAPNALLPDAVRFVHLAEVGVSNAVFGWVVGWVMSGALAPRADANSSGEPSPARGRTRAQVL